MPLVRALRRGLPLLALLLTACGPASEGPPTIRHGAVRTAALQAYCSVNVQGVGEVDVESDYLPHVVACENGAADDEALRAQAVAARSYLYYKLATGDGSITDGEGDQVYTCNNAPSQRHYDAVATTAGEVLLYDGTLVAAFYVAGAVPQASDCVAAPDDNDYSSTEHYVTYNWGAAGSGLEQTSLGWPDPGNHANRGCQSQNGADCLSEGGWPYEDILRFYYGMDIDHVVADGPCVAPTGLPHGCGLVVDGEEVVFDESGACFLRGCASAPAWEERPNGVGGASLVTGGYASDARDCFGRWQLSFAEAGEHIVDVHVPDVGPRVSEVRYTVRHAGQDTTVVVPQADASGWISLGAFSFAAGSFQFVELGDVAPENGTLAEGPYIVFDAVRVRSEGAVPQGDAGVADEGGQDPGDLDDGGAPDDGPYDGGDGVGPAPDLPPSVVNECACATSAGSTPSAGLFASLFGLAFLVVRRRPSRTR